MGDRERTSGGSGGDRGRSALNGSRVKFKRLLSDSSAATIVVEHPRPFGVFRVGVCGVGAGRAGRRRGGRRRGG